MEQISCETPESYSESSASIPEEDQDSLHSSRMYEFCIHNRLYQKEMGSCKKIKPGLEQKPVPKMLDSPKIPTSQAAPLKTRGMKDLEPVKHQNSEAPNKISGQVTTKRKARLEKPKMPEEEKVKKIVKTPIKTKKPKSGFRFWNIFTWGCKGKSKVQRPKKMPKKKKELSIDQDTVKPPRSLKNGHSLINNSLLYGDSDLNSVSVLPKVQTRQPQHRQGPRIPTTLSIKDIYGRRSKEISPDSDDLSSFSCSESQTSEEKSSHQDTHIADQVNEEAIVNPSHTSSNESEAQEDPSISSESEESEDNSSEEKEEDFDEVLSIRETPFIIPRCHEEEKRLSNFSSEFDEISGTARPASKKFFCLASSIINDISAERENGREIFHRNLRESEGIVAGGRPLSSEGTIIWTQKDDTLLKNIIDKQQRVNNGCVNWARVEQELTDFCTKNNNQISKEECKRRYHQLTKIPANKNWTFEEIEDLIIYHKRYQNNWKRIAKKIPSKNDKQCKYKYEQLRRQTTKEVKPIDNREPIAHNYYGEPIQEEDEESKNDSDFQVNSGDHYKHIIDENSQSGSSKESFLFTKKYFVPKVQKVDRIQEEIGY